MFKEPVAQINLYDMRPEKDEVVVQVVVNNVIVRTTSVENPKDTEWDLLNDGDVAAINDAMGF